MITNRILQVLLLLLSSLIVAPCAALEIVGSVGGSCPSVAARDGYVYLCEGRGLTVLDARSAGDPVVIERVRLDAGTTCVRLDSDVAYVGTVDGKVRIYNVSTPASPALLSTLTGHGALREALFNGIYAYLACDDGVLFLDVSDPTTPVELSFTAISGYPTDLALRGDMLYAPVGETISIIDVTDRAAPSSGGSITLPPPNWQTITAATRVACDDDRLYVVWSVLLPPFPGIDMTRLAIYDLASGPTPQLIVVTDDLPARASAFALSGQRAFIAGTAALKGIVSVFDVSDPASPTETLSFDLGSRIRVSDLSMDGDILAISRSGGWTSVKVPESGEITVEDAYTSTLDSGRLAVSGGVCFVAQGKVILLADVTDPHRPEFRGHFPCGEDIVDVESGGRYVYTSHRTSGLSISCISNSSKLVSVAAFDPLAGSGINDVTYGELSKHGNLVVLAYVSGTVGDAFVGLVTIDVSNPELPILLGSATRPTTNWVDRPSIARSGTSACVSWDRLIFFNIAHPGNPHYVSDYDAMPSPGLLFWDGNLIAVSGVNGTQLVDVGDLSAPTDAGMLSGLSWHLLLGLENGRLYAGLSDRPRFRIYDAASSQSPVPLDSLSTLGTVTNSVIYGGHVYALDPLDGLLIAQTNFPDHLAQRHLLGSDTGAADQNGDGVIDAADLVLAMEAARR